MACGLLAAASVPALDIRPGSPRCVVATAPKAAFLKHSKEKIMTTQNINSNKAENIISRQKESLDIYFTEAIEEMQRSLELIS